MEKPLSKPRASTAALRKASKSVSATVVAPTTRTARLGLRSSEAQLAVLRRAAEAAHKSLTDFILDSACLAAEQTLLDQRLFMASSKDYQAFLDLGRFRTSLLMDAADRQALTGKPGRLMQFQNEMLNPGSFTPQ